MTSWDIVAACPQGAGQGVASGREFSSFLISSGSHVMMSILPGALLLTTFVLAPRDFLMLGPTALSLSVLALIFVVAFPLHAYKQFQLLAREEADPIAAAGDVPIMASAFQADLGGFGSPRSVTAKARATGKRPEVVALELELLRRLGPRSSSKSYEVEEPNQEVIGFDVSHLSPTERLQLRRAYADLDLPMGASVTEVRRAYRRTMSIFHPDRFGHDQASQHMATELSRLLAAAYNRIISTLSIKLPNR